MGYEYMLEIEVLENKIFFRDGMRLAGPLDHDDFPSGLVRIADEFQVEPSKVLIAYIEYWLELNPELIDVDLNLKFPVELPPPISL